MSSQSGVAFAFGARAATGSVARGAYVQNSVDQSTISRWVKRFLPLFGEAARKHRDPVGLDWRVDETYARIRGRWHYIYRAIDAHGQIVNAYVSPSRDIAAAHRFFEREIACSGTTPRRVITDKAATDPPALATELPGVPHRTGRYRTNGIERDHGFLKERLLPMRGLKSVASAAIFTRGHALMRNIRRGFHWNVESVPQRLDFAWTWNQLALALRSIQSPQVTDHHPVGPS